MEAWTQFRRHLGEDQKRFLELVVQFFSQFFENEFVSRGSEARLTAAHVLAVLGVPTAFYTISLVPAYDNVFWNLPEKFNAYCLIDECRYVTFTMVVVGFVALLQWEKLFLDGRDYAILTPLPLKPVTIFTAKVVSLVLYLLLFLVDVAAVPTLLYPIVETMAMRGAPISALRFGNLFVSHAVAVFSSGAFAFLFFASLQGVLINLLSARAFKKIGLCIQIVGTVGLLLMLFLLPIFSALVPEWQRAPFPALYKFPPIWFVGLYQTLLGSSDALFRSSAKIAVMALSLVALACVATYTLNYRRDMQRALESTAAQPNVPSRWTGVARWLLTRAIVRRPRERATFFFTLITLARSSKHRLYITAYTGVGLALALFGIVEVLVYTARRDVPHLIFEPHEALLALPLILSFFLLSGMRLVFTLPADLPSNWAFQIAENEAWLEGWAGVRKTMIVAVVILLLALCPFYAVLWGWGPAVQQFLFSMTLSLVLIELLLLKFRKIPFTCSYRAGKANLTLFAFLYWFAFTTYAYAMAAIERWTLQDDARWFGFLVLLLVVLATLTRWRKAALTGAAGNVYEDSPDPEVQTLGLGT
jgi:hypothetical protein